MPKHIPVNHSPWASKCFSPPRKAVTPGRVKWVNKGIVRHTVRCNKPSSLPLSGWRCPSNSGTANPPLPIQPTQTFPVKRTVFPVSISNCPVPHLRHSLGQAWTIPPAKALDYSSCKSTNSKDPKLSGLAEMVPSKFQVARYPGSLPSMRAGQSLGFNPSLELDPRWLLSLQSPLPKFHL